MPKGRRSSRRMRRRSQARAGALGKIAEGSIGRVLTYATKSMAKRTPMRSSAAPSQLRAIRARFGSWVVLRLQRFHAHQIPRRREHRAVPFHMGRDGGGLQQATAARRSRGRPLQSDRALDQDGPASLQVQDGDGGLTQDVLRRIGTRRTTRSCSRLRTAPRQSKRWPA